MIDRKHSAFQRWYLWHFQHKMTQKRNLFGNLFASNSFDQDKELVLFLTKWTIQYHMQLSDALRFVIKTKRQLLNGDKTKFFT